MTSHKQKKKKIVKYGCSWTKRLQGHSRSITRTVVAAAPLLRCIKRARSSSWWSPGPIWRMSLPHRRPASVVVASKSGSRPFGSLPSSHSPIGRGVRSVEALPRACVSVRCSFASSPSTGVVNYAAFFYLSSGGRVLVLTRRKNQNYKLKVFTKVRFFCFFTFRTWGPRRRIATS